MFESKIILTLINFQTYFYTMSSLNKASYEKYSQLLKMSE